MVLTKGVELAAIFDLDKSVQGHLENLGVQNSHDHDIYSEKQLIEDRSWLKFSDTDQICPKHRKNFGLMWKAPPR